MGTDRNHKVKTPPEVKTKFLHQGMIIGRRINRSDLTDTRAFVVNEIKIKGVYAYPMDEIKKAIFRKIFIHKHDILGIPIIPAMLRRAGFIKDRIKVNSTLVNEYYVRKTPLDTNVEIAALFKGEELMVGMIYERKELIYINKVYYFHEFQNMVLANFNLDLQMDPVTGDDVSAELTGIPEPDDDIQ